MDDARHVSTAVVCLAALLLSGGCSLTSPGVPRPILDGADSATIEPRPAQNLFPPDPFLTAMIRQERTAPLPVGNESVSGESALLETNIPDVEPAAPAVPRHGESEAKEETFRADLAEQEAILSKDVWIRNLVLDRWIDNDMKNPFPVSTSASFRKRSAEIERLNLSNKEREKRKQRESDEYLDGLVSTWRWFHREMEQLSSVPVGERINPEIFLRDPKYSDKKHKILRANTAILIGRDGGHIVVDDLVEIVNDKSFRTEMRCAAAETLGKLSGVTEDRLISLLDSFKEKEFEVYNSQTDMSSKKTENGIPPLWQELLYAVAEKIQPWEHPCFLEPFSARSFETRLAAARLWRLRSQQRSPGKAGLPEAFLEYARRENGEMIRIEIIRTLGLWKTPDVLDFVNSDLHRTVLLREAALDALAEADCRQAIPTIRQWLRDSEAGNRAPAVAALRKFGEWDDVFKMSEDRDVKVRIEVAKALAVHRSARSSALAKRYLGESNEKLLAATLDAVACWPIEEQGELLLEAARSTSPKIRSRAAESLARHGIEVDGYDPTRQPKEQEKKIEELARRFHETVGGIEPGSTRPDSTVTERRIGPGDPLLQEVRCCLDDWLRPAKSREDRESLQDRLTSLGDRLLPYLDYLYETERRNIPASLDPVLAEVEPVFAALRLLDSETPAERRKGAMEIRRICQIHRPNSLVVGRVLDRATEQSDFLVLDVLLGTLREADEEAARRLAGTLLKSDSGELRRKACEILADFGNENDLDPLIEMLDEPSTIVQRSVLQAIVSILDESDTVGTEAQREKIDRILLAKLMRDDVAVQVDVAAMLHRLGNPTGAETLRRLSVSPDHGVRVYVAKTVTALEDPVFIPTLIRFLDDRSGGVRKAALDGLPKLAGEDVGWVDFDLSYSPEVSITQQKVQRWKNWFAER